MTSTAPTCHLLSLGHSGQGSNPVASPTNSTGCATGQYVAGEAISLSGATPDTGWHISGWTGTSNNSSTANSNSLTMPDNAHAAGVDYAIDTFTLSYTAGAGGSLSGDASQTVNYGEDGTAVTAVPDTGYQFVDWSDGVSTASRTDTNVTANVSVTANFVQEEYTLTVDWLGNGNVARNNPGPYHYDDIVQLTAYPDTDWSFTGWTGDLTSSDNPVDVTIIGDMSITANFELIPITCYALTLSHTGDGSDPIASPANSTGCANGQYVSGEGIALSGAVPNPGWRITGWTGTDNNASLATSNTVTMPAAAHEASVTYAEIPLSAFPIAMGATWKYLDNGSNQGTAWKEVAFNDVSWASGPAELGYGDGDEATVVDCSGVANCNTNNYITTYFRYTFNVPDRSLFTGLNLSLIRDDGVVVYLNGTEIWRDNMPASAPAYNTLALTAIGGTGESTPVGPASPLANTLVDGMNVLAVEIHQAAITSTDISFNLSLSGVTPPVCYPLTLTHTGNGADPTASPTSSTGCSAGQYVSGESITLTAAPASGHQVGSWNGTTNDSSTELTNTVTMPASAHSAGVNYVVTPPSTLVCESFNAFTPGSRIGTYPGWYDAGAGPVVTAGNGVASSIGLAPATSIYNWTAHPFNWNAGDFEKIIFQQDFQSNAGSQFDDDRLSWTINGTSNSSSNQFGVQLDNSPVGINTYWSNGSTGIRDVIAL